MNLHLIHQTLVIMAVQDSAVTPVMELLVLVMELLVLVMEHQLA
jgi:hypothetical protein